MIKFHSLVFEVFVIVPGNLFNKNFIKCVVLVFNTPRSQHERYRNEFLLEIC